MRQTDIEYAKTWRLRKALTDKRKALAACKQRPMGLSRLMQESLEAEIPRIQAELARRAAAQKAS